MNPFQFLIDQGRAESSGSYAGTKWVHYATFVALGTSVLYFTLELDKQMGRKAGKVAHAIRH